MGRVVVVALTGALALAGGALSLHVVHAVAGHLALTAFGPIVAALVALTIALLPYPGVRPVARVTLGCAVLLLLLGVEWIESELAAGHQLVQALAGHGVLVAAALGFATGLIVLVQAARAIDAVLVVFALRRRR